MRWASILTDLLCCDGDLAVVMAVKLELEEERLCQASRYFLLIGKTRLLHVTIGSEPACRGPLPPLARP